MASDASKNDDNRPVVLVTGCAKGGIGYEYCRAFSALGCRVVATDIPEHVPDLAADMLLLDDGAETLPLDVTSEESVEAAVCRVMALHGRIDVLVNNGGIGCTGPLAELPAEAVRRAVDVNFLGQVRTVRAVAARGERGQRGRRRRHAVGRALLRVQGGGARGHGRAAAGAPAAGRARGEGGAGGWAAPTWRPSPGSRDGACTAASRRPSRSARARRRRGGLPTPARSRGTWRGG
jgi:NAD(P)-dependent dehydrogenase (short-subunit alcohol dehydrogenase family)